MKLDINNKEVRAYTDNLRKLHRSNLPIVIRQTLNDTAFDVKVNTLLKSADKQFILRSPGFFKKHSMVKKADGFNINTMRAEVGIVPGGNYAATQLTKQELGGSIRNRTNIYLDTSRTGGNKSKLVKKPNYLKTKGFVHGTPNRKRSEKSQFIANAYIAKKLNLFLKQDNTVFNVEDIKFNNKSNKVFVKMTPISDYEKNRTINLIARPFLRPASEISYKKQNAFFIKNANKRFKKDRQ